MRLGSMLQTELSLLGTRRDWINTVNYFFDLIFRLAQINMIIFLFLCEAGFLEMSLKKDTL